MSSHYRLREADNNSIMTLNSLLQVEGDKGLGPCLPRVLLAAGWSTRCGGFQRRLIAGLVPEEEQIQPDIFAAVWSQELFEAARLRMQLAGQVDDTYLLIRCWAIWGFGLAYDMKLIFHRWTT